MGVRADQLGPAPARLQPGGLAEHAAAAVPAPNGIRPRGGASLSARGEQPLRHGQQNQNLKVGGDLDEVPPQCLGASSRLGVVNLT